MQNLSRRRAFTMVELVVVLAVLAILSGVLVPRVNHHMKAGRDAQRLADLKTVRNAIEQFHQDKGRYPEAHRNNDYGNWDVSHDGNFIPELLEEGYLDGSNLDPVNDATFHYRYYLYAEGTYGCQGKGPFYVLGIRAFESPEFARKNRAWFKCADRNWSEEFQYVTGGGAEFLP